MHVKSKQTNAFPCPGKHGKDSLYRKRSHCLWYLSNKDQTGLFLQLKTHSSMLRDIKLILGLLPLKHTPDNKKDNCMCLTLPFTPETREVYTPRTQRRISVVSFASPAWGEKSKAVASLHLNTSTHFGSKLPHTGIWKHLLAPQPLPCFNLSTSGNL